MRLEKAQQCSQERWLSCSRLEFIRPDSGQIDEPLRPTFAPKRCRESGKGKSYRIILVSALQGLRPLNLRL